MLTNLLWSLATPIQTGILGHLSSDAIAANSVSTTMFQYLKVITLSEASATSVSIGKMVGEGATSREALRPYVRTLQLLFLLLGLVLGGVLLAIRTPLLQLYVLSPSAKMLSYQLLGLMTAIFIGMGLPDARLHRNHPGRRRDQIQYASEPHFHMGNCYAP